MAIDVTSEVLIDRPTAEVAAYAMDPAEETRWIGGIVESRLLTSPPLGPGTRVERVAYFLGRRIEYVLEVVDHDPHRLLAMRSLRSPFPMEVTYQFDGTTASTRARIHVRGGPGGLAALASPLLARAVKHNITSDLQRLKHRLESPAPVS
jgi:hypothetical protein